MATQETLNALKCTFAGNYQDKNPKIGNFAKNYHFQTPCMGVKTPGVNISKNIFSVFVYKTTPKTLRDPTYPKYLDN